MAAKVSKSPRRCVVCGGVYLPNSNSQKYCGAGCARRAKNEKRRLARRGLRGCLWRGSCLECPYPDCASR